MSIPGVPCPNCGYDSTNVLPRLYDAPSPFQHLFDGRASREEISAARPQMQSFIGAVRDELHDAEARVARLREALQAAEHNYTKAAGVLSAHIMLIPPIHYIPTEILSYIFSLTFEKPFHIFESRMPWLLGQVCRHWRAVAWQNPSLWNSFVVGKSPPIYEDFPSTNESSRKAFHVPILEDVLNRSGNTHLEVSLVNPTPGGASILARHATRLSELRIGCNFDTLRAFKNAPEMSMLTKLCLSISPYDEHPEPVHFDITSKAPLLTHVVLQAEHVAVKVPRVILLPWSQITHLDLELGENNYHYIIDILSQCQNLMSFTDSYREDDYGDGEMEDRRGIPPSIYVFPLLTFLSVRIPLAILSYMQCPALQTFALRGYFQDDEAETDWGIFRAFMDRSRCTLQEVHLIPEDNLNYSTRLSAPLRGILGFVSHVPRVEIDLSHSPDIGLKGIINRKHNVIAFPELQVLVLKTKASVNQSRSGLILWQQDELIGAVESSWWVPEGAARIKMARIELATTIRHLHYRDFEDLDMKVLHEKLKGTELLKKMKILKDEGLDVSVVVHIRWAYHDLSGYLHFIVKESTMRCL